MSLRFDILFIIMRTKTKPKAYHFSQQTKNFEANLEKNIEMPHFREKKYLFVETCLEKPCTKDSLINIYRYLETKKYEYV